MDNSALAPRKLLDALTAHPLGVGCWAIGGPAHNLGLPMGWSTADDSRSLDGLHMAFQHGANLFDTADVYGLGRSERLLGRFLKDVPRADVFLTSKVGYMRGTAENAYAAPHLRHQFEQTLENLGTDYLDVYFLHNFDFGGDDRYLDQAVEQLNALKQDGLIRAVGMRGPHRLATERLAIPKDRRGDKRIRFAEVFRRVRPDVLCTRYNALSPETMVGDEDLFTFTARQGVALLLNKPLAQGLLTGKYDPNTPPEFGPGDIRLRKRWFTASSLDVIQRGLRPLRDRFGDDSDALTRVALRYCLQRAEHAVVLCGFTGPEQVERNYTCLGAPLSEEEFEFARGVYARLRADLDRVGEVFLDEVGA
ncbi:aldo/keto reductase [Actinacidiphila glaucinigra]|uniref:aldo/keto reductase n=1 Tax=Actinacidiphila glaucinigra TaxID=235986 RepID=UPI0037C7643A